MRKGISNNNKKTRTRVAFIDRVLASTQSSIGLQYENVKTLGRLCLLAK